MKVWAYFRNCHDGVWAYFRNCHDGFLVWGVGPFCGVTLETQDDRDPKKKQVNGFWA